MLRQAYLRSFTGYSLSAAALLGLSMTISGCGTPSADPASSSGSTTAETAEAHDEHDGHTHDGEGEAGSAMEKLSAEDRALAEAQKVCVVSDEPLGSMGTPVKVEHDGQVAFLCCEHCREAFEGDPATYLAKLKGEATGEQTETEGTEASAEAPSDGT